MDLNFTCKKEDRDLDRLIMDDQLDKLYQTFNNYDYLHNDEQSTIRQISREFEAFERTELPLTTKKSIEFNNNIDQLGENVHEFEMMVEEMDYSSNVHPSYSPFGCYSNVNVACYDQGDGSDSGQLLISGKASSFSNYDHLNNDAQSSTIMQISKDFEAFERTNQVLEINDNIDQLGEDVVETERMIEEMASQYTSSNVHPSYKAFGLANDSSNPVIRYFFCGQTNNVTKGNNHRRNRQKRKYRGVVMSEEQRRLKMAKQKIKNREVAARTYEMRLAREAYLESQHLELLMQNDFFKKMVTFLEGHKRVNVPPEPLRRTISGPILIQ